MSYSGDMDRVVKAVTKHGWRHQMTERGHHQFLAANGHDIVHTSGTPGDVRAWNAFASQMKRAGFDIFTLAPCDSPLGSLGDAMVAAGIRVNGDEATAPALPPPGAKLSARSIITDYLSRHPNGAAAGDIFAVYKSLRPDMTEGAAKSALTQMELRGLVIRVSRGHYRLATDTDRLRKHEEASPPAIAPPNPIVAAPPPSDPLLETSDIEREFDDAVTKMLDAFTTVEKLVNKYRGAMKQIAAIKKVMGEI